MIIDFVENIFQQIQTWQCNGVIIVKRLPNEQKRNFYIAILY
jgi:hypothetical protein